jgi:CRISPR system Cascade subunit CasC
VPQARHNSLNAGVRPAYVLGRVRPQGPPIQLVNAFEKGIWKAKEGITNESIEFLKEEHASMKRTWNLQTSAEVSIPDVDVETFINQLVSHAV